MALSSAEAYSDLRGEATQLLNDIGQSLTCLLDAPASDGHAEAHIDLTKQLGAFFSCYYKLRKRLERDSLSVAVLALTKSGKSTLINAFLANEILPVNNVPETARICRINHTPTASCPEPLLELTAASGPSGTSRSSSLASAGSAAFDSGSSSLGTSPSTDGGLAARISTSSSTATEQFAGGDCTEVLVGAAAIRQHLQQLNRDVRAREHMRNDEKILNISAPLVVLDSPIAAGGAAGGAGEVSEAADLSSIQLCLLDTPGPNEAGEEGLKYQVERLLGRVDAAIYLLDYTKLKTAEEAGVLSRLKAINPQLVARLCSRLFFAVNKMDQADESCGLDEEETRAYVAEIVTQQLNCPDFKLHPDQVLLLSARDALLSRLILSGRSDPANTQRFCRVAFGAYNPKPRGKQPPPQAPDALPGSGGRAVEELRAAAAGLLEGSGVPELEERVLGFLCEAAAGVKLMATLDDTGRLLAEVSNVSSSCRAALAASSASLAEKTSSLQARLDDTLSTFDSIMEGTSELQVEVTDELRAHLGNLRTRLFQYIYNALDADALRSHQAAAAAADGEDDDDSAAAGTEAGGAAAGQPDTDGQRRHHRGHGCCHSRHRRRHGGYSSNGGGAGSSSGHFHSSSSQFQGFGFGGSATAATAAGFAAADVFTGCMPGPYFGAGGSNGSSGSRRFGGSSSSGGSNARGSSSSVPVFPGGGGSSSGSSGGGWWGLRQRFLNLFGRAGGATESKDELSSALMDLSEDLMSQIQSEVAEAWHVMEGATNERAARLTASLNGHITQLSAQLEGAVNEALQIQLEPVSLCLAAPDAVQFHADLTDLIEKGIRASQTRHVRTGERTDFVMEARRGACRLTQYYVQVPRRRRIVETYTATTYSLAPEAVLEHFMGVVDGAIGTTEAHLPGYVKEYIRRQVEQARARVQQYGNRYIDSLSAALEAASAGAESRQSALDQVSAYCDAFDALRARLAALQARAELLVPHNTASGCGLFEQVYGEEGEEGEEQVDAPVAAAGVAVEEEQEGEQKEGQEGEADSLAAAEGAAAVVEDGGVRQSEAKGSVGGEAGLLGASLEQPAAEPAAAATAAMVDEEPAAEAEAAAVSAGTALGAIATAEALPAAAAVATDAPAADGTAAASAVAAMGSSSFFAAPFDALASWMAASNSKGTAATAADNSSSSGGGGEEEVGQLVLRAGDIEGAAPAAAAVDENKGAPAGSGSVLAAATTTAAAGEDDQGSADVDHGLGSAAGDEDMPELLDVVECQESDAAAAPASAAAAGSPAFVEDAAAEGTAAAGGDEPAAAADTAAAHMATAGSADSSSSSAGSTVSNAETAVSDSFSLVSGAVTESSAFSGMTAGTAFTLQSSSSSGVSRLQEHLADSVLGGRPRGLAPAADADAVGDVNAPEYACSSSSRGVDAETAAAAAAAGCGEAAAAAAANGEGEESLAAATDAADATVAAPAVGSESLYASMYGSGLLLSADEVAGALQMSALPAADPANPADSTPAAALPAVATSAGSSSSSAAAAPAASTGSVVPVPAAAAAAEPWQGDASLYASIIAHSEDHEQPGSPFNFGDSFAAALSAAGLDSLSGPSPPSGSPRESGSEDWQIVEADVEGAAPAGDGRAGAAAGSSSSSSKAGRSWMGGRAK